MTSKKKKKSLWFWVLFL